MVGPRSGGGRSETEGTWGNCGGGRVGGCWGGGKVLMVLAESSKRLMFPGSGVWLGPSTSYGLSGQHTPGTNRDLKQMEPRRAFRSARSRGQAWISLQRPVPPAGVVQVGAVLTRPPSTPCLPSDFLLSPLIAPPMVLNPAPTNPRPRVSWAATGKSRLVTLVPSTFFPITYRASSTVWPCGSAYPFLST